MEEKEFHLKDHIMEIEKVMQDKHCAALLKYVNYKDSQGAFEQALIIKTDQGDQDSNKKIRDTKNFALTNLNESITDQHWCNLCHHIFTKAMQRYHSLHPMLSLTGVYDMQLLKYEPGGHYITHVDDHPTIPRTLSFIWRLNNDYEGGDLVWTMHGKEFHRSKTRPNSMLIWPSSFLYPHGVEPVTKGTRYSIVAWAR